MTKPWMIDELGYAGPEHLDPDFVDGYDRKQGFPDPDGDVAILREHGLTATSTLVDLGTGTGRVALAAAPHAGRVVAVDVSPAMLAQVSARAQAAGLANVEVVRAGFLTYEHTGALADAVHTRNALHQLPDFFKVQALLRIAAILRPGGVLRLRDLVYDFPPERTEEFFDGWFAGAAADPAAGYTAADYAEHIRTEFSTFGWLLEPMLDRAGFDVVTAESERSLYAAYTCVKR
ncbi:SAM-dependent methyltransferase [Allocatelliglobosispora scoriae]|uniref:SAM-dependent methyltransferase n=1 Tax=Allocatelliglobosispora scoriae TaxID=643052 RepID=A0A841BIR5_9ACTN|nr:class I SAM-dependent methyltransferase [Allocatelliglobosispora scoriae]MBB5867059.1 SAM-dependent methyltransferase [Allocatelliglobosispora scoriae]